MEPEETALPVTPDAATETPVDASESLADIGLSLFGQAQAFLESLLRPWNAYQLAIAAGLLLVAWLLRKALGPRIRAWMAARQGWPMWRMRILAFINKRIMGIFFVILIWLTVWIMREVTWPSRSYMLGIIARLATAWLIVTFVTRFVHSPIMRTILRYGAWIYVTLSITSLTDEAASLLDSVGFDFGEGMRLSLLLLVQGFVLVSALLIGARFLSKTTATRIQKNEDISPSMRVLVVKAVQVLLYGAAFSTLFICMPRLNIARNAPVMNMEPVAGMLLGWLVLGQLLGPSQVLGGLIVVGGIVLLAYRR